MRATVSLLLPAIFPSWRFFETAAPSPRIEVACTSCDTDERSNWVEFRPRPQRIAPLTYLKRLFWNKTWNETLFLVVCAERLVTEPSPP